MKKIDFIKEDEPLCNHSTIKIGGNARYFAEPKNFKECLQIFDYCEKMKLPFYILGNGSNTLCASCGYKGVVLITKNLKKIYFHQLRLYKNHKKISCFLHKNKAHTNLFDLAKKYTIIANVKCILKKKYLFLSVQCGYNLPKLTFEMCQKGFKGLEFACSIPATLGGAVKMNAGAFNGQMSDFVYRVLVYNYVTKQVYYKYNCQIKNKILQNINLKMQKQILNCRLYKYHINSESEINNIKHKIKLNFNKIIVKKNSSIYNLKYFSKNINTLDFNYRYSNILDSEFIICADLILESDKCANIEARMDNNIYRRRSTQNVCFPSLGSAFKKCGDISPAKLIQDSGLKGLSIGGAMVSKVHSGYIVNFKNATSQDICKLLKIIRHIICKKYNIMLQYEVKFLGDVDEEN